MVPQALVNEKGRPSLEFIPLAEIHKLFILIELGVDTSIELVTFIKMT